MKFKMAAAAILDFVWMAFLITCSDLRCYVPIHTKFEPNPSILGKVMAIFPKSKMTAVRHFGIVMTSFMTIVVVLVEYLPFGNVMSVLKFHSNKLLSFEYIEIFIFLRLG